jgi:hypothetical protein
MKNSYLQSRIGLSRAVLYGATVAVVAVTVLLFFAFSHAGAREATFYFALCYVLAIEAAVGVLLSFPGRLLKGDAGRGDAATVLFFVAVTVLVGFFGALPLIGHLVGLVAPGAAIIAAISVVLIGGAVASAFAAVRLHNSQRALNGPMPGLVSPHSHVCKENAMPLALQLTSLRQLTQDRFPRLAKTRASQIGVVISLLDQASVDVRSGFDSTLVMAELQPVVAALEAELVADVPGGAFSAASVESLSARLTKIEALSRQIATLCSKAASI